MEGRRDPVVHEFGALLGATAALERIAGRELERRCGIKHATFEVLLHLDRAGADQLTMGELAERLILTSGGMTRLVDRLETAGLVSRHQAPGDRRRQLVALTEAGRDKLAEAAGVHTETLKAHFSGPLSGETYRTLIEALTVLRAHARVELGDLR
ncbi:MarR family transcriptional regulator [Spirillospora sp. NPDC047279]|uniref:MarR family winged helix-turn-helix transcriptional regulator n=1 Tax=Spirillospora sp. NPDC047279 TaxID=3155478 RepID=UPI0033F779A1